MSSVSAAQSQPANHWPDRRGSQSSTTMTFCYGSPETERKDVLSSAIFPTTESYYRIMVGSRIKYLSIAPGIFDMETLRSTPHLFASLPPLPSGDWTVARLLRSGRLEITTRPLPGIRTVWHPARFDLLTFRTVRKLSERVYEIMHPSLSGTMIAKYARFHWEIPAAEHETRIYREIEGKGIGPEFLGHIHEHGRVVGFLLRNAEGRYPEGSDYRKCVATLAKLHSRGIQHGGLKLEEFIITEEGDAILLDFEKASFEENASSMRAEMNRLESIL